MHKLIHGCVFTLLVFFTPQVFAATQCHVDYNISNDWGNGFTAAVKVKNQGDALDGWLVTWDMPNDQRITGLWKGSHAQNGQQVTVTNPSWKRNIATGASFDFGFNGAYSGDNNKPTNIRVNGTLCLGQATPPPPPSPPPQVACRVDQYTINEWGTNNFTANVAITNTGDKVSGWNLTWDMPNAQSISNLWNGQYTQNQQQISVSSLSWNKTINNNVKLQFGFNASHDGINQIPGNIALNGVVCDGQTPPPPIPEPVIACEVDYHIRNQWTTGFTTDVTIRNTGDAITDWDVTWSMPNNQNIDNLWNGNYTQTNDVVTVSNLNWNRIISPNASLTFGFNATHTGINPAPIDLALNGIRCEGQADTVVLPPSAPENLEINLVDNTHAELNWVDASDNEDTFILQRRTANGNWATLTTLTADTINYTDSTLVIGTAYDYQVQASNTTGDSGFSNIVSATRQDRTDIKAPMLANSCASCHGTNGVSSGPSIPSISGLDRNYFIKTMQAYQTGARASSIMDRIAKGYTETQITRLADYFANLPFVSAEQTTDQALVNRGQEIHKNRCIFCHAGVGDDDSTTGTRLDGQWAIYLNATLEDYHAGRNSNTPPGMTDQLSDIKTTFGEDALLALAEYYAASPESKATAENQNNNDNGDGSDDRDNGDGDGSDGNNGGNNTDDNGGDGGNTGDNGDSGNTDTAPTAPAQLSTTVIDNDYVYLAWQDNSQNETGFRIERRITDEVTWQSLDELAANTTSYTDRTTSPGISYDYRVVSFNDAGENTGGNTPASLLTLLQYGEQQYQQQSCATCHGSDGKGGFTNHPLNQFTSEQLEQLTHINQTTMPPSDPTACEGNCALGIAHYITEVLAQSDNNGGGDDNNAQACTDLPPPGERSLRLLTRQEYQNTVNDLLNLSVSIVHNMPEENRVAGYDNNVAENLVTGTRLDSYLAQAENLANQSVQQSWDHIVSCNTEDSACARTFISEFGLRSYRRPLTTTEIDTYLTGFNQQTFRDAVENTIMAMMVSPHFLYRSELGELQADGTYELTPYEVASSLSYLFLGSMPDSALFQAAADDELATPEQRIRQASRLLSDSRSRQQVGNFVGQWLLSTSPYTLPNKNLELFPGYTDDLRASMSQELISFFNHVAFDSTQNFNELFAANYVIANKTLADFYQLTGPTSDTLEYTPVTDETRGGILGLGAVLSRYANSSESHPFKRGAFLYKRILCHEMPEPENAGVVEAPTPDPDATTRERFAFHSQSDTSCFSCHQFLDDPGFSFENYNAIGEFRSLENGQPINASGIIRGMETYNPDEQLSFNDLQHLSTLVSDSDNAAACVAKQYYRFTTGRIETPADECAMNHYIQNYADNGYNLQTMLLGIVAAPGFTTRRAD